MNHLPNKDKTRYQHLELQSSQIVQDASVKSIINNNQDNVSLLELIGPTIVNPKNCNIAEAQDKNLQTAFMNMLEVLKKKMYRLIKEIYKSTVLVNLKQTKQRFKTYNRNRIKRKKPKLRKN